MLMSEIISQQGNDIVVQPQFTAEQIKLIKDTICIGATDDELKIFLYVAQKTGLDPFTKQIYSVGRWNNKEGRNVRTIQTGIDGFRVVAQRSGEYEGQIGPFWTGDDGVWVDVWLKKEPPRASKVGVYRKGFKEPLFAVANWDSYVQKDSKGQVSKFWASMSALMIAKVAEALALRKAFPQDLSGIYTPEEMAQAENEQPQKQAPRIVSHEPTSESKKESTIKPIPEKVKSLIDEITVECRRITEKAPPLEKFAFMKEVLKVNAFKELHLKTEKELEALLNKLVSFPVMASPEELANVELPNVDEFLQSQGLAGVNKSEPIKETKKEEPTQPRFKLEN